MFFCQESSDPSPDNWDRWDDLCAWRLHGKGGPNANQLGKKNMSCPQIPERFRLVFHGPGGEIGYLRIPNEKDFLIWYIVKSIVAVWR